MFDIEYKGANSVIISTKNSKLVINPRMSLYGEKDIIIKDGIELATEDKYLTGDDNFKLSINCPGNFEISDFSISGFPQGAESTAVFYSVELLGVRIGIIGSVDFDMNDSQLEDLGVLDILILPVGNSDTIDTKVSSLLARRSEANVIIPIKYEEDGVKYGIPQPTLVQFSSNLGYEVEEVSKYKVKSVASLPDKPTIIAISKN